MKHSSSDLARVTGFVVVEAEFCFLNDKKHHFTLFPAESKQSCQKSAPHSNRSWKVTKSPITKKIKWIMPKMNYC